MTDNMSTFFAGQNKRKGQTDKIRRAQRLGTTPLEPEQIMKKFNITPGQKLGELITKPPEPEKPGQGFMDKATTVMSDFAEGGITGALDAAVGREKKETEDKYQENLHKYNRRRYETLKGKKSKKELTEDEKQEYIERGGSLVKDSNNWGI